MLENYVFPDRRHIVPLRDLTMSYVHHVLSACSGNKSEAARALAISRRRLYHWLSAAERTAQRQPRPPLRKAGVLENREETDLHAIFELERWLTAPPLSEIAYSAIQTWFRASHVPGKLGCREATDVCLRLAARIVANFPTGRMACYSGHTRRCRVLGWTTQVERLHRLDGIGWGDVHRVVLWSQEHPRWRTLVLGGDALRLHWDAMVLEMAQEQR